MKSRVLSQDEPFRWGGVPAADYKRPDGSWSAVTRFELVADAGTPQNPAHLRYFEIEPGGRSSFERHEHEHLVIVARGSGSVRLGVESRPLTPGDVVHVVSGEAHQFLADAGEPLGFFCVVPAERDRPVPLGDEGPSCDIGVGPATPSPPAEPHGDR